MWLKHQAPVATRRARPNRCSARDEHQLGGRVDLALPAHASALAVARRKNRSALAGDRARNEVQIVGAAFAAEDVEGIQFTGHGRGALR